MRPNVDELSLFKYYSTPFHQMPKCGYTMKTVIKTFDFNANQTWQFQYPWAVSFQTRVPQIWFIIVKGPAHQERFFYLLFRPGHVLVHYYECCHYITSCIQEQLTSRFSGLYDLENVCFTDCTHSGYRHIPLALKRKTQSHYIQVLHDAQIYVSVPWTPNMKIN